MQSFKNYFQAFLFLVSLVIFVGAFFVGTFTSMAILLIIALALGYVPFIESFTKIKLKPLFKIPFYLAIAASVGLGLMLLAIAWFASTYTF